MDKEQLKEIFLKRLFIEYELFKDSMLRKERKDIFDESYRIEIYKNIYQILIHEAAEIPETVLRKMVYQSYEVMEFFYQEWLKREDSSHTELSEYVSRELEDYYMELEREMSVERNTETEGEIKTERKIETKTEIKEKTAVGKEGAYGKGNSKVA